MIDYSNYSTASIRTFENSQESITFAPILFNRKLLVLSLIFLFFIILNVVVALQVSILNYNINNQEKILKNLQIEKTALLNKLDSLQNVDKELQEASKLGLKPINTDQIKFYSE